MTMTTALRLTAVTLLSTWCLHAVEPEAISEDAPVLAEHEPLITDLVVTNPYDTAVRIIEIDQSCTCEKLELGSDFLLPGESTTLHLVVDNTNRSGAKKHYFRAFLSDPEKEPIVMTAEWHIRPDVAVDVMPVAGPFDQRPANNTAHDIYMILENRRPEAVGEMLRYFRLFSETLPAGELQVEGIDYAGQLWTFQSRQQDDGSWLVRARGNSEADEIPAGAYEEEIVIRTNHPNKPAITLHFKTQVDPLVNTAENVDPWANFR